MITKFEFQISNYCNRRCPWCPQFFDKKDIKNTIMDEKIIDKMLNNFIEYNYLFDKNVKIAFTRYNEPIYNHKILYSYSKKIKDFCRKNVNNCIVTSVNTNGDFLNLSTLYSLQYIDRITINDYNGLTKSKAMIKILQLFGLEAYNNMEINIKDKEIYFNINEQEYTFCYSKNQYIHTRTRGNLLKNFYEIKRDYDCDIIGKLIEIDYNGDVYPCCEVSSMNCEHIEMCCGNILKDNFLDIYNNIQNIKFDSHLNICSSCEAYYGLVK